MAVEKRKLVNGSSIESDPTKPAPVGAGVSLVVDAVALVGPDSAIAEPLPQEWGTEVPLPPLGLKPSREIIVDAGEVLAASLPTTFEGPMLKPIPTLQYWWRLTATGRGSDRTYARDLADQVGLEIERHETDRADGGGIDPDLDTFTVRRDGKIVARKVKPDQLWYLLHAYGSGVVYGSFKTNAARDQEMRPELNLFVRLMESRLRENEQKGGWKETPPGALWSALVQNFQVCETLFHGDYSSLDQRDKSQVEFVRRLVNVANYAMMVADTQGGLDMDASKVQDHFIRQEIGTMPRAIDRHFENARVGSNMATFVEMMRLCAVKFEGVQMAPENALEDARDMVYRLDARWHQNEPARNAALLAGVATRIFVAARAVGALRLDPSEIENFLH